MPASLTQSGQTQSWLYTPEHDRYKMVASGRTTWYLNPSVHQGGHYERTLYTSGTVEHRVTLYGGGRAIGEVLTFEVSSGTAPAAQTRYFHSDTQGSITAVTDSAGVVLTRFRYDAWGKQTLTYGNNTGINATRQGHTSHEMLDGGLTHMNGRLYDPVLSRFVSADPTVDNPFDLQSLNRYSYVNNNPMGFTDPTGYFKIFGKKWSWWRDTVVKPVVAVVVAWNLGPMLSNMAWNVAATHAISVGTLNTMLYGGAALTGATAGYIASGGDMRAAGYGALGGALFFGAGEIGDAYGQAARVAAHAGAGCISASASGGNCGSGALGAGFSEWAGSNLPRQYDGFVVRVVLGGTAAELGGGKFANGATTAAFGYLFNYCAHNGCFNRRFNWNDAVDQWRNGNGSTVTDVKASELNLTNATYAKNADGTYQIHTSLAFDTGAIYGTVTGVLNIDGTMSIKPDTYNFDFKNPWKAPAGDGWRVFVRDVATGIGLGINGFGTAYRIGFTGTIPAPKDLPR